ncbi:hypothetical protein H9L39_06861 [Fusarium oxysporum f. sp. albedinis]|nr:hypothetical protein H9L39_06861 [Fusarium oxysporum f. sp. albedinis]
MDGPSSEYSLSGSCNQSINPRGILELTLANETLAILVRLRPVTEQLEARATCLPHFGLYSLDSPQNQDPSSSLAHPDACKPYHLRRGQGTHHRKVQLCEPEIPFDKGR